MTLPFPTLPPRAYETHSPHHKSTMSNKARRLAYKHLRRWQRAINRAERTGRSQQLVQELTNRIWLQFKDWKRGASDEDTVRVRDACEATKGCLLRDDFVGARAKLIHLQLAL